MSAVRLFLTAVSGVCWTGVYIHAIILGFRQKTFAIPMWSLALNLGWEFVYTFCEQLAPPNTGPGPTISATVQSIVNLTWFAFDVVIVVTLFRFGHDKKHSKLQFRARAVAAILMSLVIQVLVLMEFGIVLGSRYSAFTQNLFMSVQFVDMLTKRGGPLGQSMFIAINKCIGTLAPTILMGWIENRPIVLGLGVMALAWDLLYIVMLRKSLKAQAVKKTQS